MDLASWTGCTLQMELMECTGSHAAKVRDGIIITLIQGYTTCFPGGASSCNCTCISQTAVCTRAAFTPTHVT